MSFDGQVAVVTGGAQGIGEAAAEHLIARGARVVIWDIEMETASMAADRLGKDTIAIRVDVSDWCDVEKAFHNTMGTVDRIDVMVNSAGIVGGNREVADYPVDEFWKIIETNLLGTFHTNRVVVPLMKNRNYGRIVNIASIAGKEGNPKASAYSASKAGVIGFTKSLGKELAGYDIAVNCVTPALIRTRIFDDISEEYRAYLRSLIPRDRFLTLDEVASMITWLASRENSFSTGAVFDISGGRATY